MCATIALGPLIRDSIHAQEGANLPAVVVKFRSDYLYAAGGKTQHILLHDLHPLVNGLQDQRAALGRASNQFLEVLRIEPCQVASCLCADGGGSCRCHENGQFAKEIAWNAV